MPYKQKSLGRTTHSMALFELIHLSTLSTKREKKSSKKRERNTTTTGYATKPKQTKQLSLRIKSPTSKLQNNPASLRSEGGVADLLRGSGRLRPKGWPTWPKYALNAQLLLSVSVTGLLLAYLNKNPLKRRTGFPP